MKRFMIALIVAIPLASVVMGAVMLYLASGASLAEVEQSQTPLSKTSWKQERP